MTKTKHHKRKITMGTSCFGSSVFWLVKLLEACWQADLVARQCARLRLPITHFQQLGPFLCEMHWSENLFISMTQTKWTLSGFRDPQLIWSWPRTQALSVRVEAVLRQLTKFKLLQELLITCVHRILGEEVYSLWRHRDPRLEKKPSASWNQISFSFSFEHLIMTLRKHTADKL